MPRAFFNLAKENDTLEIMMKNKEFIVIGLSGLALDQLAKYFLLNQSYLNINFAWGWPVSNTTVVVFTIVLLLGLVYYRNHLFGPTGAWWLLGAGAVSNLLDRLGRGGVVDYIFLPYGGVINLADIMVIGGLIWILCSRK